jgi:hypothetical protein
VQLWERLLYSSGGKLEIPKCNFSIFDWTFNKFGRAHLSYSIKPDLEVISSGNNTTMTIPFLPVNKAYKYVGIQIALDGNMDQQVQDLQTKCTQMASCLLKHILTLRILNKVL